MNPPDIYWTGASGKKYGYWIHPVNARFRKIAGNVVFARKTAEDEWEPLYIGQTRNFDFGFADEQKENCAKKNGATHVHVHFSSPDEPVRNAEKKDLVAKWKPICNS